MSEPHTVPDELAEADSDEAVRQGGRDPAWAWDELVLACTLVVSNGWRWLSSNDSRVIELSQLLQRLPLHDPASRTKKFRNPNGVARKTADLATIHPDYSGKRTKGGRLDHEVLHEFRRDPARMHAAAVRIREGVDSGQLNDPAMVNPLDVDEIEVPEGRLLVRRHLVRERSRKLRDRKIAAVQLDNGRLVCEACSFDFEFTYGRLGRGYIECHHVVPLHEAGEGTARLSDLALLCSNCHRMIHRQAPWPTPAQLSALIRKHSAGGMPPGG